VLDETDGRSQVRILEDELKRYQVSPFVLLYGILTSDPAAQRLLNEAHQRYRKEQELLLSAIHGLGMHTARDPFGRSHQQGRALPTSWLGQQRQNVSLTSHPGRSPRSHLPHTAQSPALSANGYAGFAHRPTPSLDRNHTYPASFRLIYWSPHSRRVIL
jgi:hypothetical protein